MEQNFRVGRYRKANRGEVFELLRVAFPAAFVERTILQWDWKYDANPFNREAENARRADQPRLSATVRAVALAADLKNLDLDLPENPAAESDPYCLLLRNAGALVGMIGGLPQQFVIGGGAHWVSDGGDFVVHPQYRGQQLSVRLGKVLAADNLIIQGWSNSAGQRSSRSVIRGLRDGTADQQDSSEAFHSNRMRLLPLFKPIDFRSLAEYLSPNHLVRKAIEGLTGSIDALRRRFIKVPSLPALSITEAEAFDDRIDQLWDRARNDYPVIAVRNRRYLNWRFVSRPDASYRYLFAFRANEIVGYLVFRLADRDGMRCGYVVDYLVENQSTALFSSLLTEAEARMTHDGAKAIICAIAPTRYRSTLWRHGFYAARMATTPSLEAGVHLVDPALKAFIDLEQWFVTMGDGNLELSY
jgi:GNAT superfamily N-acetyltransferase